MTFSCSIKGFAFCAAMFVASSAQAEDAKSILVLDASGSMWGQIEGEAKITIARRVIAELLETFPEDQALGLSAYGHNRKGDCSDIEQLVPPAVGSREAIKAAVEALNPKGKTPLSAAVIAAAKELRSEEEPATVILISDGIETCELDPCEVGAELERAGVDFTAHVIGFDVSAPEERAQLACLAENTGGQFLAASNASELAEALETVAEAPAPKPEPEPKPEKTDLVIEVTDGEGGPVIQKGLLWTLTPGFEGGTVLNGFEIGTLRMSVLPGDYRVNVAWPQEENVAAADINVAIGEDNRFVLPMLSNLPDASVSSIGEAEAGTYVAVEWTGPDENLDFVSIAATDARGNESINLVRTQQGSPLQLQMPATPGDYELRYVRYDGREVLASQQLSVVEGNVSVSASDQAGAGETIVVEWAGPDSNLDYIAVAAPGSKGNEAINLTRTQKGSPLQLQMPAEPGTYELRYVLYNERAVLASVPIEIIEGVVSVTGPEEAEAGTYIAVEWVGPDENLDYIAIAEPGSKGGEAINLARTKNESPLKIQMPAEPGDYELRYVLYNDRVILAAAPIRATASSASVSGPSEAAAGSYALVEWAGPDSNLDFVDIAPVGAAGNKGLNVVRTKGGSPLRIQMPAEPGAYELRYVLYNDRVILARASIKVTPPEVTLSAPSSVGSGQPIVVEWTGPNADLDFIAIAPVGVPGNKDAGKTQTREGSPLIVKAPDAPGDYEVRYVLYNGREILARKPITVE